MNTLKLTSAGPNILVPCPVGKRVRVVAVNCAVSGHGLFDSYDVYFQQGTNAPLAIAKGPPLTTATTTIAALINATPQAPVLESTAAGVAVYETVTVIATIGLPDLWWMEQVNVVVTPNDGGAGSGGVTSLLYEVRDAESR